MIQRPGASRWPSAWMPGARQTALLLTTPSSRIASGRFAMIDDGLSSRLVPTTRGLRSSSADMSSALRATVVVFTEASGAIGQWAHN